MRPLFGQNRRLKGVLFRQITVSKNLFQVEVINIGTEKHVPIPEFYEETIEVTEREIPGTGSSEKKDSFFEKS